MKTDFVVVSFSGEFAALLLQARSIARSNASNFIKCYYIIWNDHHDHQAFSELFLPRLQAELGQTAVEWRVVLRSELIDPAVLKQHKGPRIQQALKLLAARVCTTDAVCVLDTKNHVIRPLDLEDFVSDQGLLRSHNQSYPPNSPFNAWYKIALAYFGIEDINSEVSGAPALPSTTPYIMSRPVVLDMLKAVERKEAVPFALAFLEHSPLAETTEFLLYCAFVLKSFGTFGRLYHLHRRRNYVTFFTISPVGPEAIQWSIREMRRNDIKFIGLHRRRRERLTDVERDAFTTAWVQAGLFSSQPAAQAFLDKEII
ncbi:DUF6492 family protein [Microvirga sp. 0TCS3.31]